MQTNEGISPAKPEGQLSRRQLLTGAAALAAFAALPAPLHAFALSPARTLAFEHLHTGERLAITYWEKGKYLPQALRQMNHLLRDHRTDEVHAMDPGLFDVLASVRQLLDVSSPMQIISGYRSPRTNTALRRKSNGVAARSLHMDGKAIDIAIPGHTTKQIRDAAMLLKAGGVGHYPEFVHLDTGKVRYW